MHQFLELRRGQRFLDLLEPNGNFVEAVDPANGKKRRGCERYELRKFLHIRVFQIPPQGVGAELLVVAVGPNLTFRQGRYQTAGRGTVLVQPAGIGGNDANGDSPDPRRLGPRADDADFPFPQIFSVEGKDRPPRGDLAGQYLVARRRKTASGYEGRFQI
tara:strand:- start:70 stop:549 length:480 start_codon:yes stop_codon:yes gene_type:complete